MKPFSYIGQELELFAQATNWKRYFRKCIASYIQGDVLEVGAGSGTTTKILCDLPHQSWTCLEPDSELANQIPKTLASLPISKGSVFVGTLKDIAEEKQFDTILYIDVLEHIEDDRKEIERALQHLKPGGHIIVLSPAHPYLFTPFDAEIGHYRRYNRKSLTYVFKGLPIQTWIFYLDAAGLFASLANRLLLKQKMPTLRQIRTWDRILVPISKYLDKLLGHRFGKTIIGILQLENSIFPS